MHDNYSMTTMDNASKHFDLTPHPRILPMLGEIVLPQWRCLAELIDNSVDSFIEAERTDVPIQNPLVSVSIPTGTLHGSQLTVRDNGPGMDPATLEHAARAGWTSHDPINNLGLFGMGFNIATARLGYRTIIWTTCVGQSDWVGLEIDFEQLARKQAFSSPMLSRIKPDPDLSGTEVIIERLKSEQLEWFSKGHNRSSISKQLGKIYSSMIGPARKPVGFRLEINGSQVRPKLHCIWGGPGNVERSVESVKHSTVNAFQSFDVRLEGRLFCTQCWNWLGSEQTICPSCNASDSIVLRERRVHGWLGIQRYLDRNDFGIDILRNGRKIEIGNKDLFKWYDEGSDTDESEYPIDDPRDRGRIVGEVHLDHCRVPYTKDRFVREDAAWREMVEIVRGKTPLRPDIAQRMGLGENSSPLYRLFQVFRRSNPHNRKAGGWSKLLVVPDNERAQMMARRFDAGESEYQTDEKWWELIEEAEAEVLQGTSAGASTSETLGGEPAELSRSRATMANNPGNVPAHKASPEATPIVNKTYLPSLSRQYVDDITGQRFEVEAYAVDAQDPMIMSQHCPWLIRRTTRGPWEFYVNTKDPAFRSITLTPLDALLAQLAWLIADFERGQGGHWTFGDILASLRKSYASTLMLDPKNLVSDAAAQLVDIARSIVGRISEEDARTFFEELSPSRQEGIRVTMASRGVARPYDAIEDGRFLQYSPPSIISVFVLSNPDMFFDGKYWDDPYSTIDYGSSVATEEARTRLLAHFGGLLSDMVWLAQQTPTDLEAMSRERLMRASLATVLLAATGNIGDSM